MSQKKYDGAMETARPVREGIEGHPSTAPSLPIKPGLSNPFVPMDQRGSYMPEQGSES